jgi:hypothetical protein
MLADFEQTMQFAAQESELPSTLYSVCYARAPCGVRKSVWLPEPTSELTSRP